MQLVLDSEVAVVQKGVRKTRHQLLQHAVRPPDILRGYSWGQMPFLVLWKKAFYTYVWRGHAYKLLIVRRKSLFVLDIAGESV